MGWAQYFVRRGFPTYVVDQVARGRSSAPVTQINRVKLGQRPVSGLPEVFAASHEGAWTVFRFGPVYPKLYPGMRFPIQAQAEFWKQMVPDWNGSLPTPNPTVGDLSILAARLGRTVLISHSESGIFPFQAAARSRQGISAIVAVEPGKCPATDSGLSPYIATPILVLWGDNVETSPRWAPRLEKCRAFVRAIQKLGGNAELLELPKIGIRGNTHMLMQDDNNLQIADLLIGWLNTHVKR
jgi:pimeloyl-ACP methyl ester carboxylesterase